MRKLVVPFALAFAVACGEPPPKSAYGSIKDVVVVLKGSDEPLPFDPRGGRITIVTQEIARLMGHPVVLELDTALSPELKASLEETVLASFENIARELVLFSREDPAMFAKAKKVVRVRCTYDAVAKESVGVLEEDGTVLAVRAPPDRFPLLERWVVTEAVYLAHIADLEGRWGEVDPTRLAPREQAAYFEYMTKTRPGAGYLWIAARRQKGEQQRRTYEELRLAHVGRIVKLASVVEARSSLERKVRRFLLEHATYVGGFGATAPTKWEAEPATVKAVLGGYDDWLARSVASFDDEDRAALAKAAFATPNGCRKGSDCSPGAVFPRFDRFGFGLSIYDAWVKAGARTELAADPSGRLFKEVVGPVKRRGEAETEILYGSSTFFALALRDPAHRARLGETITRRKDIRLLETAVLNLGYDDGADALALVEGLKDEALFRHGTNVLFHDLARRDDVKSELEKAAPRWWRDTPGRRGVALLVMARQHEGLHVHYGDNQWTRFVAEFGGPIGSEVFAAYLAEGPRAVEMAPKLWPALAKNGRDNLLAKNLAVLLDRDHDARSSRGRAMLVLLRRRLCDEKDASGLALVRAALERWSREHPDDAASVSNALADFTLARCPSALDSRE